MVTPGTAEVMAAIAEVCASWRGRVEDHEIAGALHLMAARIAFVALGESGRVVNAEYADEAFAFVATRMGDADVADELPS